MALSLNDPELDQRLLQTGLRVEVWCRSNNAWAPGFQIVDWDADHAAVRRSSDQWVLPERFAVDDVRAADTETTWS